MNDTPRYGPFPNGVLSLPDDPRGHRFHPPLREAGVRLRAWCRRHAPTLGHALAAREPSCDVSMKRWSA